MEKSVKEVFNEIQTTIDALRVQLDELEERLASLKEAAEEPVPVVVEPEPEPIEPAVEPEPEPIAIEQEPAPAVEPEPEVIDLSIDMAGMGARTVPDAKNYQWMIDLPGGPVANVISAISLNDRVLFINTLFKEDPALFQNTISEFNKMETVSEAVSYVIANFPDWNLNSEVVYRLMMAVRRKLK